MDTHIDQVRSVMFVKIIPKLNCTSENLGKKDTGLFFVPCQRYKNIRHVLPNLNLYLWIILVFLLLLKIFKALSHNPFLPCIWQKNFTTFNKLNGLICVLALFHKLFLLPYISTFSVIVHLLKLPPRLKVKRENPGPRAWWSSPIFTNPIVLIST